ncbi:hypothetical protein [Halostella sp. PRR32]|uniref:hypothetical protein n=1 Tax=Halostella sp. PRR32 TaxID=3098147 RepID=UPI002B1E6474|nr:hypothetical protein [Halostella sp. PRR32]
MVTVLSPVVPVFCAVFVVLLDVSYGLVGILCLLEYRLLYTGFFVVRVYFAFYSIGVLTVMGMFLWWWAPSDV